MVSKKKLNVVLTVVVLGLWSAVLYKYVDRFIYPNEISSSNQMVLSDNIPDKIKKDTFALVPLTNDPFLGKSASQPVTVKKTTNVHYVSKLVAKVQPQQTKSKVAAPFPMVKYYGFIKSKEKKDELILLKVGNILHKTRLNESCSGVIVKKIFKDSLQVVFEKEVRMIKRNV